MGHAQSNGVARCKQRHCYRRHRRFTAEDRPLCNHCYDRLAAPLCSACGRKSERPRHLTYYHEGDPPGHYQRGLPYCDACFTHHNMSSIPLFVPSRD